MPKAKSKPTKTKVAAKPVKRVVKKPVKRVAKRTNVAKTNPILAEIAREERSYHFLYTLVVLFLLSLGVYVYYFFMK